MLNKKTLDITLTRPTGAGGGAAYSKKFHCADDAFGAEVLVEEGGAPSKMTCSFNLFGVSQADIEAFTSLVFKPLKFDQRNRVEITTESSAVFKGDLKQISGNFGTAPDISLQGVAILGYANGLDLVQEKQIRRQDNRDIHSVFNELALELGMTYKQNSKVSGIVDDVILQGTKYNHVLMLAKHCGVEFRALDGILQISKKETPIDETPIEVSAQTGLIGYPSFTENGLKFKTAFNPSIHLFTVVNVKSIVPKTSGLWHVKKVMHRLSVLPNGKWEQDVECYVYQRNL